MLRNTLDTLHSYHKQIITSIDTSSVWCTNVAFRLGMDLDNSQEPQTK